MSRSINLFLTSLLVALLYATNPVQAQANDPEIGDAVAAYKLPITDAVSVINQRCGPGLKKSLVLQATMRGTPKWAEFVKDQTQVATVKLAGGGTLTSTVVGISRRTIYFALHPTTPMRQFKLRQGARHTVVLTTNGPEPTVGGLGRACLTG